MKLDQVGLNHSLSPAPSFQTVRPPSFALSVASHDRAITFRDHECRVVRVPAYKILSSRFALKTDHPCQWLARIGPAAAETVRIEGSRPGASEDDRRGRWAWRQAASNEVPRTINLVCRDVRSFRPRPGRDRSLIPSA